MGLMARLGLLVRKEAREYRETPARLELPDRRGKLARPEILDLPGIPGQQDRRGFKVLPAIPGRLARTVRKGRKEFKDWTVRKA